MPTPSEIDRWVDILHSRYVSYLTTSFHFRDPTLRQSFREALGSEGENLLRGPFPEHGRRFPPGIEARELARETFPEKAEALFPALLKGNLHFHQEHAIRAAHFEDRNVVVASGTGSGKTECFLYPVLFYLFQEHLAGTLDRPGVRALVLYPMNALVNDQRRRLGGLCGDLANSGSDFRFTFGQYIGQTPKNAQDRSRNGAERGRKALPGEKVFREDMLESPPHILFTNYSMLEYLLIRPQESALFDEGRGEHWRFLILDEAHAYRGAKGIEMAMLLRRLKERLREGGRRKPFRCLATSATIASGGTENDRRAVADFAGTLFGEPFEPSGVVFGKYEESGSKAECASDVRRYHLFVRALEGAFLLHDRGQDRVVLNRVSGDPGGGPAAEPLEIALCRECGQHYYVGKAQGGKLVEAVRDPARHDFGVDFYLPSSAETADTARETLCRRCGAIGRGASACGCEASIPIKKGKNRPGHSDQLRECARCGYRRGGVGDPVQEIVHGADGPNAVLATAVHGLLPKEARKILAFADSRQDAAFFAWYAEDSYTRVRDRNLMLRALCWTGSANPVRRSALSVEDFGHRLVRVRRDAGVDAVSDTAETVLRRAYSAILTEALTEETRLSLEGVGIARWSVQLPVGLKPPREMQRPPWNFTPEAAAALLQFLLARFREVGAIALPDGPEFPDWKGVSPRPQRQPAFAGSAPRGRKQVSEWGGETSSLVKHFLPRLLGDSALPKGANREEDAQRLMKAVWAAIREHDDEVSSEERLLERAGGDGAFRLKAGWLRVRAVELPELRECGTCARITPHDIRRICPRSGCRGALKPVDMEKLSENHYRTLYELKDLPAKMTTAEHTAQLADDEARRRQAEFQSGEVHLLSSSTTFEVGVDLGDLEVTFLRNVPPEPFNYAQRVGRAGRRKRPGLALTYCRRGPHDLHYFQNPKDLIAGTVVPPRLGIANPKIVTRHLTAVALSAFFRDPRHCSRSKSVEALVGGDWSEPSAAESLKRFCEENRRLSETLRRIVPQSLYEELGLGNGGWIDRAAGLDSRLAEATSEVCDEYRLMKRIENHSLKDRKFWRVSRADDRMRTISKEGAVTFLARRAVIPKYGFPVDVVELHTGMSQEGEKIELSRDLSLAIAEYAPGSSVVANKLEWKSVGIRKIEGKEPRERSYGDDEAGEPDFTSPSSEAGGRKYLVPEFGFETKIWDRPKAPERRNKRLYSTRPFFRGFTGTGSPDEKDIFGIGVSEAVPGELVVLCEGSGRRGFLLCGVCGKHEAGPKSEHFRSDGQRCSGCFRRFSLGHDLKTDVVKVCFPEPLDRWGRYSVGYALLLGAADAVAVPERDLNVTLAPGAVVLYDDVPGGAGLVAQLTDERSFRRVLERARDRVAGGCGCDRSCYGCLRSYRNQFAHPHLARRVALGVLEAALERKGS